MIRHKRYALCVAAVLIALDQLVKIWALGALPGAPVTVIPGLFKLSYVENRGAAFGIFQGGTVVLGVVSAVVLLGLLFFLLSKKVEDRWIIWSLALILAGGFGNLIDRFARGFVVDYLDFSALFGFPVFNLADCCVVCGTAMVLIYILFLEGKKPKAQEPQEEEPATEDASTEEEESETEAQPSDEA